MKRVIAIRIPAGFDPNPDYDSEGNCTLRFFMNLREIEAPPLELSDEFREFVNRAGISEFVYSGAFEAAHREFEKTFAKLSVIETLEVFISD